MPLRVASYDATTNGTPYGITVNTLISLATLISQNPKGALLFILLILIILDSRSSVL